MPTVSVPAIRTSPFSFVRFSDNHMADADWMEAQIPGSSLGFSLPVALPDDIAFQFIIESDDTGDIDGMCSQALSSYIFKLSRGVSSNATIDSVQFAALPSAGTFTGAQLGLERYRLNDNQILFFVPKISNIGLFNGLTEGECFQIAVREPELGLAAISNVFYYSTNTDFNAVVDYYSEYDEAEFYYCISPTLKSRIRLPLYPTKPSYPEEESIYRQSDGRSIIQKSTVREVFEVVVDEMPNWAIQSVRAILLHDDRFIESLAYSGAFSKEGAFNVEWSDFMQYPLGKPGFSISTDTNLMKNNNCGDCEEGYPITLQGAHTFLDVAGFQTLTLDLNTMIVTACCSPLTFHDLSHNTTLGIILSYTLSGAGILTIHIGSVPGGAHVTFQLFTINATCGNATSNTLTINGRTS